MPEVAVTSLDPRQQKQIENAQVALQRGNLEYVIDVCDQILKAAPGCLPVRRLQRVAQLKKFQTKSKFLTKAFGSVTQAGFLFSRGKDPVKMLESAEKMLAADPSSVPALKMLAEAAGGLDLPETVSFAWECVRDQQPNDHETLVALGEAYLNSKQPKDALRIADQLLKVKPQDGDALDLMRRASIAQTVEKGNWEEKGSFRDKLRDEEQAVSLEQAAKVVTSEEMTQRLINEALERHAAQPDNINHFRTLIDSYRKLNNLEKSLEWARKARLLPAGAADTAFEKLVAELELSIVENRVKALEVKVEAAPNDTALVEQLKDARTKLATQRLDEARSYVERYPNDYGARFTLANLYFDTGDYQQAIANYQQAQKNPKVRISALAGMGRALKARRMFDLAVAQFQTAKTELPTMDELKKDVIYELASCYEAMGKTNEAINEYKVIYSEDIGFRDVADKINAFYASH